MKANEGNCFNCGVADLQPANVQFKGKVRGEDYSVSMRGLKCPNCGFQTIEGQDMPEYGRLLADKYRSAHDLLTSDEIIALRHGFRESQQAFSDRVDVGVASIKRWELGKIQDKRSDEQIRQKTKPQVTSINQYEFNSTGATLNCGTCRITTSQETGGMFFHVAAQYSNNYVKHDEVKVPFYIGQYCTGTTAERDFALVGVPETTAPRHLPNFARGS